MSSVFSSFTIFSSKIRIFRLLYSFRLVCKHWIVFHFLQFLSCCYPILSLIPCKCKKLDFPRIILTSALIHAIAVPAFKLTILISQKMMLCIHILTELLCLCPIWGATMSYSAPRTRRQDFSPKRTLNQVMICSDLINNAKNIAESLTSARVNRFCYVAMLWNFLFYMFNIEIYNNRKITYDTTYNILYDVMNLLSSVNAVSDTL